MSLHLLHLRCATAFAAWGSVERRRLAISCRSFLPLPFLLDAAFPPLYAGMARKVASVSTAAGWSIAYDVRDAFQLLGAKLRTWCAARLRANLQRIQAAEALPE